jgi:hypothetical protein
MKSLRDDGTLASTLDLNGEGDEDEEVPCKSMQYEV